MEDIRNGVRAETKHIRTTSAFYSRYDRSGKIYWPGRGNIEERLTIMVYLRVMREELPKLNSI